VSDKLVCVYRFRGSAEANLWKEKLRASGIKAAVINDVFTGAASPDFELQVNEKDVKRTQRILKPLKKLRPFKASRASIFLLLFFGIIMVIPGILVLAYLHGSEYTAIGIIALVYGGAFLLLPLLGIIRRKNPKK
jgi:hypothetical protein